MPGVIKLRISSGVTGREHAYATISSIGALSQCERPAGIFLVDLPQERYPMKCRGTVSSTIRFQTTSPTYQWLIQRMTSGFL